MPSQESVGRLYDRDRLTVGTLEAMERARARGGRRVEPDDLLAGILSAIAVRGVVSLGTLAIDLPALGLSLPIAGPRASNPVYAPETAAIFDDAVRVARREGLRSAAPVHFLIVFGELGTPLFLRMLEQCDTDLLGWRVALASVVGSADASAGANPVDPAAGPRWLSVDAAATRLGRPAGEIKHSIAAGLLPAFRVDGEKVLRVREDDLELMQLG